MVALCYQLYQQIVCLLTEMHQFNEQIIFIKSLEAPF